MMVLNQKIVGFSFLVGICLSHSGLAKSQKIQGTISTQGYSKSEYSSLAKISLEEAIKIALKQSSGKIVEAALEKENDFLVYEVDVLEAHRTKKEFLIDAGSGQVLHVKERKPNSEDDDSDED